MNKYRALWWEQAKSDHNAFLLLRGQGAGQCHSLHYLQMVTEKIAKAYFWRSGLPPPRNHAGLVQFLRFLGQIRQSDRTRVANLFSFARFDDFQNWMYSVLPIAYDLERLAPTLAENGPNPEYPWPHEKPNPHRQITSLIPGRDSTSGHGRDLMRVIHIAVRRFPEYADV